MFRYSYFFVLATVLTVVCSAQDVSIQDRLKRLESENQRILNALENAEAKNQHLESEIKTLKQETETLSSENAFRNGSSPLETQINHLLATEDDTRWSSATKSGLPIRFYGFLRMDLYYNDSKTTLDTILTFAVLPEDSSNDNDDSFVTETRLVRFGFDIDAGEIAGAKVMGKLETDFANFILARESRSTPRIRLAYIDMDWGEVSLRFGQDWDVISPLYPHVHNELLLWGAGNLGDRRPQIQFTWKPNTSGTTQFILEASIAASGAVDGVNNDGAANLFRELDGFDSGHPHGQMRAGLSFDTHVDDARATIGVWGYIAGVETDTSFNGNKHYTPWTVGFDLEVPIVTNLTLRAEGWYGQALSDVRGNILQSINTVKGDEISGWGGWAEFRLQATENLLLVAGGAIDDPDNGDLESGNRSLNWLVYLGAKYNWGGGLVSGIDLIYWETEWKNVGEGDLVRLAAYIQLNF